jgi:hypothetical protein
MRKNVLICGLGGGLDVLNCLPLYYKLKEDENYGRVLLGSIRPAPLSSIEGSARIFHLQGTEIYPETKINYKGRYAEPFISKIVSTPIVYFARSAGSYHSEEGMAEAFNVFVKEQRIHEIFFVDGGGDSMTLKPSDIIGASQSKDVFKGGDAFALKAITDIQCKTTLCVAAVGLDVNREEFITRLDELAERNIYLGSVNLRELPCIDEYVEKARKILYRAPGDDKEGKFKSHTGSVLFCSVTGDYGVKRTYVQWEGEVDGEKGVMVEPHHAMMYMFKANKIHPLKLEYNEE